jgi:hypothetical protein
LASLPASKPDDNILQHALAWAARGFKVIPLLPGAKEPAYKKWQDKATSDPATIATWWADGKARNYGIVADGLLIVDLDTKKGKPGLESWQAIGGEFDTLCVRTPTGGFHLYYASHATANTSNKLGAGIDTRGHRASFVVGPGSLIDGAAYEVRDDKPVADAPEHLLARLNLPRDRAENATEPVVDLDLPVAIEHAARYLAEAPEAVDGAGGDQTTFNVACGVRDLGIAEDTALDLMLQHWNDRCSPPWDADELAVKVRNAYAYGQNRPGQRLAALEPSLWFDVLPAANENGGAEPKPRKRLAIERFNDAAALALADKSAPLIKGLLDQGAMSVLYGDSNTGKTFVATDMAYHIAEGLAYAGMTTTKLPIVYVAAEGGRAVRKRLLALRAKYGPSDNFFLIAEPVNLRDPNADTAPLIEAIAKLEMRPGLVVIDTLSRAIAGGEENSSVDMGALVANFDRVRAATGAHLLVVHHTGKNLAKGARGHSLLRAATDTELEVQSGVISATKQRDMDGSWSSGFRLEPRVLGLDDAGDPVTSCTVKLVDVSEVRVGAPTAKERDVLDAVKIIQTTTPAGSGRDGVSVAELIRHFADNMSTTMHGETLRTYLRALYSKKMIEKSARGFWKAVSVEAIEEPVDAESGCFA